MRYQFSILILFFIHISFAGWGTPPEGWDDYRFGLVNDRTGNQNARMKQAVADGIDLDYRYVYIRGGVDTTIANHSFFNLFPTSWNGDYIVESEDSIGVHSAFVIYMITQQDGGIWALRQSADSLDFMLNYFGILKSLAQKVNGKEATIVVEPDTWGYILAADQDAAGANILAEFAHVNDLGLPWLSDMPNTIAGITQGIIKTFREFAPDAYVGHQINFWDIDANGKTGDPVQDAYGFADWNLSDIEYSAEKNIVFLENMFGNKDRGDFIAVEKNGLCAGAQKLHWAGQQTDYYYWNDEQNDKWLHWSKMVAKAIDLPLLGWQISIGHMGLANVDNSWEDTFFEYFFNNVDKFTKAGFIGFLVGKGHGYCTDYSLESEGPDVGDGGWFFNKLSEFDVKRPYNLDIVGTSLDENNSTFSKSDAALKVRSNKLVFNQDIINSNSNISVKIINSQGKTVSKLFSGSSNNLKNGLAIRKSKNIGTGAYWILVNSLNKKYRIPYIITK